MASDSIAGLAVGFTYDLAHIEAVFVYIEAYIEQVPLSQGASSKTH